MDILFKKTVSGIYEDIKDTIKKKNYSKLLDYFILFLFCSSIVFVIVYKISINLESFLFDTSTFVLSDIVKSHLPQLMIYTLLGISFLKWILITKKGIFEIKNIKENHRFNDSVKFHFKNTNYSVSKNTLYTLGLIFIIFIFIVTKIAYWDISFTINHPLKYNTYVDPALSMFKNNDPFIIQRKYMHNPLTNSLGMGTQYGNLPLLEWFLFLGYKIFSSVLPIEVITRMIMLCIGSTAFISIYYFIKKIFNEKYALLTVFLLAFNTIFNLASFVTVYDTINFAITFFSLSLLINSSKQKNIIKRIFLAGIILGIGASIKENILMWTIPTVLISLFYLEGRSWKSLITKTIIYLLGVCLPYIITFTSINYFPKKEPKYFIIFFILSIISLLIYTNIEKIFNRTESWTSKILYFIMNHKKLFLLFPVVILIGIKIIYSTTISEEFLTDWQLLFNVDLYNSLLNIQLIPYVGKIPFYIFLPSILFFIVYNKNKKENVIVISLLLGSIFYIIMASKVLYFHSYYWLFILATISLLISWMILFLANLYKEHTRYFFLLLLLGSLFLNIFPLIKAKLNREYSEVYDVIDYINSETLEDGTSYIDQSNFSYFTIKTNLYRLYDNTAVLTSQEFVESVSGIGLAETMRKYKITYLITPGTDPDYTIFASALLGEKNIPSTESKRTSIILSSLYGTETSQEDLDETNSILEKNNISDQFKLIKDFGGIRVYKLTEACFKTVIE